MIYYKQIFCAAHILLLKIASSFIFLTEKISNVSLAHFNSNLLTASLQSRDQDDEFFKLSFQALTALDNFLHFTTRFYESHMGEPEYGRTGKTTPYS